LSCSHHEWATHSKNNRCELIAGVDNLERVVLLFMDVRKATTSMQNSIDKSDLLNVTKTTSVSREYHYAQRDLVMTAAEAQFFKMLDVLLSDNYFVFPQVHLPALFEHKVKGQNWWSAFQHINRKSVDFVVCDKERISPLLAIELDDWTHDLDKRIVRDEQVEEIFKATGLPLYRFRGDIEKARQTLIHDLSAHGLRVSYL